MQIWYNLADFYPNQKKKMINIYSLYLKYIYIYIYILKTRNVDKGGRGDGLADVDDN